MSGCHLTNRNCSGDCDEANQMRIELPKCSGVRFQKPGGGSWFKGKEEMKILHTEKLGCLK